MARIVDYRRFVVRCLGYLTRDRLLFTAFIILALLAALTEGLGVSLLVPLLDRGGTAFASVPLLGDIGHFFNRFEGSSRIVAVAVAMAVVVIGRGAVQYSVDVLSAILPVRLLRHFSLQSYGDLLQVELQRIVSGDRGELTNAITSYPGRATFVLTNFATLIAAFCILSVYSALMVTLSWRLTLVALGFVAVMTLLLKRFTGGPLRGAGALLSQCQASLQTTVQETLSGMKVVRLSAAEKRMYERFGHTLDGAVEAQRRLAWLNCLAGPALTTGAGIFLCALLLGSAMVKGGDDTSWVDSLLLFLFLLFRMLGPVTAINTARARILSDIDAFDRLSRFHEDMKRNAQRDGRLPLSSLSRDIVFERLDFAYGADQDAVLQSVDLHIRKGEMVAVVGPSGSGKSTLVGLLTRLYDPTAGRVLVDGVDLRDVRIEDWRAKLSVVSQDVFLFNDTVANNIAFPRVDVPIEEIKRAATLSAAAEFIEQLPDGYDTVLGDRGMRLSGGQQQRIAIARAILANPQLLVMDEATSHLDSIAEEAIQRAMDTLSKDRTLVVIAHRLSTIRKADKIVVMKKGRIVEQGAHLDLIGRRGVYHELLSKQQLDLVDDTDSQANGESRE